MDENRNLDDLLAEFTDAVLSGRETKPPQELEEEGRVIRLLAKTIAPSERLDPAFQQRITRSVMAEWDETHQRRASRSILSFNIRRRYVQLSALAAAILVLILVAVLLPTLGDGDNGGDLSGNASGFDAFVEPAIIVVTFTLIAAAGFFFWNRRK